MKIKELFADKNNWTCGAMSRNMKGERCSINHGVCWCLVGAIIKCYGHEKPAFRKKLGKLVDREARKYHYETAIHLNDQGGYDKVISLVNELDI